MTVPAFAGKAGDYRQSDAAGTELFPCARRAAANHGQKCRDPPEEQNTSEKEAALDEA